VFGLFNWSSNITLPKLTDVINASQTPPYPVLQIFTYIWIWFLGGWFFAGVIGVIGAVLYEKYENVMVPIAFFVVMMVFFGPLLRASPVMSSLPSAEYFSYILGLIIAFGIGLTLYMFFRGKNG
jgi:uncharacterized membrane protein YagU involved in acid resistance